MSRSSSAEPLLSEPVDFLAVARVLAQGVAGVDDELGLAHQSVTIERRVVGDDDYYVEASEMGTPVDRL